MKAKEYAKKIIDDNYSKESIDQMVKDLVGEMKILIKNRNCQRFSAYSAVFSEMDQKYRAICKIVNNDLSDRYKDDALLNVNGFQIVIYNLYSDSSLIFQIDSLMQAFKYVSTSDKILVEKLVQMLNLETEGDPAPISKEVNGLIRGVEK